MATDYRKWDNLEDSDEEQEKREQQAQAEQQEQKEKEAAAQTELQEEVDIFLKRHLTFLYREKEGGPPELDAPPPLKRLSVEERSTLSRFMVLVHHEKYDINIGRHHEIMNVARQNRWLEEDSSVLQLLCAVHRQLQEAGKTSMAPATKRFQSVLLSAINTLAAPARAGLNDGYGKIYELFALIGDPQTDKAWDVRAKFMKKEYAADAIFDDIVPDFRGQSGRDSDEDEAAGGRGISMNMFLIIFFSVVFALFCYSGLRMYNARSHDTGGLARAATESRQEGAQEL